jgi:hypothetical protein
MVQINLNNIRDQNDAIDLRSTWGVLTLCPDLLGLMSALSTSPAALLLKKRSRDEEVEQRNNNPYNHFVWFYISPPTIEILASNVYV